MARICDPPPRRPPAVAGGIEFACPAGPLKLQLLRSFSERRREERWRAYIVGDSSSAARLNEVLQMINRGRGVLPIDRHVPWSADGGKLALLVDDGPSLATLDVRTGVLAERPLGPRVWGVIWSPVHEVLAIVREGGIMVLSGGGTVLSEVPWKADPPYPVFAHWWRNTGELFVIGRFAPGMRSAVRFHSAEDGRLLAEHGLDVRDLAPCDHPDYARIPRGEAAIEILSGAPALGNLLDIWSQGEIDPDGGGVFLKTFHPFGDPELKHFGQVWPVEPVWVRVDFR